MASLWSVDEDNVHAGYRNLRSGNTEDDELRRAELDAIWAKFEPFADASFVKQFSRDPDTQFWEMYLGYVLLEAGKTLLTAGERKVNNCLPDICVVEGKKRYWIEAIAPDIGGDGANQVAGPKPMIEGGGVEDVPARQTHLRMTSALLIKSEVIKRYLLKGAIKAEDVRLIAIGVGRFGQYCSEKPPAILPALFPFGDEYVTVNRKTGVVQTGYHPSPVIEKVGAKEPIPRTAFIGDEFAHVSGVIWSRAAIGNYDRKDRPFTLAHNGKAEKKMEQGWPVWDKEYVFEENERLWTGKDIKAAEPAA